MEGVYADGLEAGHVEAIWTEVEGPVRRLAWNCATRAYVRPPAELPGCGHGAYTSTPSSRRYARCANGRGTLERAGCGGLYVL